MGRIATTFRRLRKANEVALIPYLQVGHPSLDATRQILPVMGRQGADVLAFGQGSLQQAPNASHDAGVSLSDCLQVAAEARRSNEVPLVFVTDYDAIYGYGLGEFAADCSASGIDGLLVPDLMPDASADLAAACQEHGIDLVFGVTTNSTEAIIERAAEMASGFVYCQSPVVAKADQTGLSEEIAGLAVRVRQQTDLPIVVGPDFSAPEHIQQATLVADGVVVSRALANLIESLDEEELILGVSDFVRSLKEATIRSE